MQKNGELLNILNYEISKRKNSIKVFNIIDKGLLCHIYSIMKKHKPYRNRVQKKREGKEFYCNSFLNVKVNNSLPLRTPPLVSYICYFFVDFPE